jgi:predicted esterase
MSFASGLGPRRPVPAGILALCGFFPRVEGWAPEPETRPELPVFITHGARDPVISVDFARDARRRLEDGGLAVEYAEHDGGHHLDPRGLPRMTEWVAERVAQFAP